MGTQRGVVTVVASPPPRKKGRLSGGSLIAIITLVDAGKQQLPHG